MAEREVFLVSGGSGGIGAAVCDQLSARGFQPWVGYAGNRESAEAIAHRTGGRSIALDLTSSASILAAVQRLVSEGRTLAGVVLAASPPPRLGFFAQLTDEELDHQLQVNVKGPRLLLAELVRHCFRKRKRGSVVGVLTLAMGQGIGTASSQMGAYVIAKYGLQGVLAALAADYPWLRVRTVSPGFTKTPMLKAFDERYLELQRQKSEFSTPEQVARMIAGEALENE